MQLGSFTVRSRAVDDSCNLEVPGPGRALQGGPRTTPCSIWDDGAVPATAAFADSTALELGVKFRADADGFIRAIRFYKGPGNDGAHVGKLYRSNGILLGSVDFVDETATGWQTATFASPIAVGAGTTYVASYWAPNGHYSGDVGYFATAHDFPPLRALASGDDGANGVFRVGGGFPNQTYGATNYWVDVVYHTDNDSAPTVASRTPAAGVGSVATNTTVSCRFSEPVVASSVVMTVATLDGIAIPGAVSYEAPERTARFTPGGPLADATTYVVTVSGATDFSGSTIEAPVSWTFTTAGLPGALPTSIWTSADVPTVPSSTDASAVELGLQFRTAVDGIVTALRYYRGGGNAGNHVGRLWALDGTLLATATFDAEGDSGWQQAPLDPVVEITAATTYVVSYLAPNGGYAADAGMFGSTGVARGPLRALAAGEATGSGNGVFRYGADGGFPNASWGNANYWVDLVFDVLPDVVGPTVANVIPAPDLVAVDPEEPIVVQFDESVDPSSLEFGLTGPGDAPVAGDLTWSDAKTVAFRPDRGLAAGTRYTAASDRRRRRRERDGRPVRVVVHDGRRRRAVPRDDLDDRRGARRRRRGRPVRDRTRREVRRRHRRRHRRHPFLQGRGERRPAHRSAVDVGRAAARLGRRRERERRRMAAGLVRRTDPGRAGPLVRRQLPHADRSICGDRRRTLRCRGPAAAESAGVGHGRRERRLPLRRRGLPGRFVCRLELLRRRALHRPRGAGGHDLSSGSGIGRRVADHQPRRHLQRTDRRRVGRGGTARRRRRHRADHRRTRSRVGRRDDPAGGTVGERDDLHGERAARPPTSPGTR